MPRSSNIFWVRNDVFQNQVSFYTNTWDLHAEKHAFDKVPATQDHFYETVTDPDHAHKSKDPFLAGEACVFTKFFESEQATFVVPVAYDGVQQPDDYVDGGKKGHVKTGYFNTNAKLSGSVGDTIWSKQEAVGADIADGQETEDAGEDEQ